MPFCLLEGVQMFGVEDTETTLMIAVVKDRIISIKLHLITLWNCYFFQFGLLSRQVPLILL